MAKISLHPKHPEKICWGCDKYCPADALACGNGTIRTPHPAELFGADWLEWSQEREQGGPEATAPEPQLVWPQ
ncbi:MAG TPA: DUF3079 domain-containing protein [Terriglobales bacterium]|nr:DUF3079 domain-containing protein [Terriglobales bacterium]